MWEVLGSEDQEARVDAPWIHQGWMLTDFQGASHPHIPGLPPQGGLGLRFGGGRGRGSQPSPSSSTKV